MSSYLNEALAFEKMQRYQAEAAEYRRMKAARSEEPGAMDRMVQAMSRGLASIGESFKVDRQAADPRSLTSGGGRRALTPTVNWGQDGATLGSLPRVVPRHSERILY